jgi:hypothetical protein
MKLDRLVNVLGSYGTRLAYCPVSRDVELYSVAMHDPMDPRVVLGDVFLAVGIPGPLEAVTLAAAAQATIVMIRGEELGEEALAAAEKHGLAVLVVDPAIAWSQLAGMVYGLVMEGRETASGRGPTDLFALADSLAGAIGASVVIQDDRSRVLAYSSLQEDVDPIRRATILERRVPERARVLYEKWGVYAHLAASEQPLFLPADPAAEFTGRMVISVRAGKDRLGSIWVESATPLTGAGRAALEDGARTVALHLLRSRASADLERHVESELVTWLLEGTGDPSTVAAQAGLPPGQFRVIAVRADLGAERHAASLLAFERATTGFGWSRPGRSALLGDTVYTILPCTDVGPAHGWVLALRGALPPDVTMTAGIGACATAAELPAGRQEADEALALHALNPAGPALAYDESWTEVLLQRLRTLAASRRRPAQGPVEDLRRYDAEHGTQYVVTLRAWLEGQGDLAEAGARLAVHPNTIRYRMRKMAEITALDLEDPSKRLAMLIDLATSRDLEGARQIR